MGIKLEQKELFTKEEGKQHEKSHIFIKNMRNESIAHAGVSKFETSLMYAVNDPIPDSNAFPIGPVKL